MPIGADKSSPAQLVEGTSPSSPSEPETSPQTELLGDTVHSEPSSPPREQLSSPSPRLSSSPPLPQPQSGVHPHHDDEWANLTWLHPGLYMCIALYALVCGLWLTWQLTHSARRTIPTQLAVAWYSLLNCALVPAKWVARRQRQRNRCTAAVRLQTHARAEPARRLRQPPAALVVAAGDLDLATSRLLHSAVAAAKPIQTRVRPQPTRRRPQRHVATSGASDERGIFVIKASGDVAVDEISVGIFVGDWKNEVLPHAQQLFNGLFEGGQLPFSRSSLKSRAVRVPDLNAAVLKCNAHDIKPVFLGPTTIDGLTTGDDVAEHLNPTENEDKCASCTCLLYTSPSPRDKRQSRMPSSA